MRSWIAIQSSNFSVLKSESGTSSLFGMIYKFPILKLIKCNLEYSWREASSRIDTIIHTIFPVHITQLLKILVNSQRKLEFSIFGLELIRASGI